MNIKYNYPNISPLNSSLNSSLNSLKFHIYVDESKWSEFIGDHNMRFFKHGKTLLQNLKESTNGHMIKISSWDSQEFRNSYNLSKKYKHPNLTKYDCYFEYESDIINYLLDKDELDQLDQLDQLEESAVIITPYYTPMINILMHLNDSDILQCIKQIILVLYTMLYKHNIYFKKIDINNIYISNYSANSNTIKYESPTVNKIKTNYVVKIDEYSNATRINYIANNYSENLRLLIIALLRQCKTKYTDKIADTVLRSNNNADDIIRDISNRP